jgi:hypothetical protein
MNRLLTKLLRAATVLVLGTLAMGVAGCGPEYDRTEISDVKGQDRLGGNVSVQRIDVPEGLVITARIVVWNDDDEPMPLTIRPKRPEVVEVTPVVNDRNYAFVGLQQGNTEIELVADGTVVLTVVANVTPQPALP